MSTHDEFDVADDVGAAPRTAAAAVRVPRPTRWEGPLTWILAAGTAVVVGVAVMPTPTTRELAAVAAPDASALALMDSATGALSEFDINGDADVGFGDPEEHLIQSRSKDDWLCGHVTDDRMRCTRVPDGAVVILDADGNVIEVAIQVQR